MILCCGEALIDMIPIAGIDGKTTYAPHPGGAVFNTAIALGRLGGAAGLVSGISTDPFGESLVDALTKAGVKTDLLIRSDRLTTLAMVHLQNGSAAYSFYDENSAGRMIQPEDSPTLPPGISALFFGGISLVNAPAADTYADLLEAWHQDRTVMLDPNIRPGFIEDEAKYRSRLDRMIGLTDVLKMSEEDLSWFDSSAAPELVAKGLLARGPKVVIVTKAEAGAVAMTFDDEVHVPAITVEAVDTVGAGDTFDAGVLFELERRGALRMDQRSPNTKDLEAALKTGAIAAAITCSRAGANPPTIEELTAFQKSL